MNKPPTGSDVTKTELVLSKHLNAHGSVFGGTVLAWADVTAALSATKHGGFPVLTAALDGMHFLHPIKLGWIVTIQGRVNESFRSSMEVGIKVTSYDPYTKESFVNSRGYFTMVAVDATGKTVKVPGIDPISLEDQRRQKAAVTRRQHRIRMRRMS